MKNCIEMIFEDNGTIPARKTLLAQKQIELKERIATLKNAVAYIDWKQNFYDDILNGKI